MTFTKHDSDKPRYGLLPPRALRAVVLVLTHGAKKYAAWNWVKCDEPMRYYDAAQRHLQAWAMGETTDAESGRSHLAHSCCCLMFMLEMEAFGVAGDERPTEARLRKEMEE